LRRIAVLLLAVLTISAAAPRGGKPAAKLDEVMKDLGDVPSNRRVEARFAVRNDGDAPLELSVAHTSCACVSARTSAARVPPAGEATILVTYDAEGQAGEKRESVTIRTNDPERSEIFLVFRVRVGPPVPRGLAADHPPTSGQNYLLGSCAACHAAPAAGKRGADLYTAVCAMCHGPAGEGGLAPSLRSSLRSGEAGATIALGTADPRMPGFSTELAGPLDPEQIGSLKHLLASWAP
jgi:mono/diheme cytochrome c family protein